MFTYHADLEDTAVSGRHGERVLNGVSFVAKQGEITALVGPSGGGKSTVSRLAARFWDADSGRRADTAASTGSTLASVTMPAPVRRACMWRDRINAVETAPII